LGSAPLQLQRVGQGLFVRSHKVGELLRVYVSGRPATRCLNTYLYELVAILSVHDLGRPGSLCMGTGATARAQARTGGKRGAKGCSDMDNGAISPKAHFAVSRRSSARPERAEVKVKPAARGSVGLYV
jgi:hypothetical protein